jgi:FG-GAP repeat
MSPKLLTVKFIGVFVGLSAFLFVQSSPLRAQIPVSQPALSSAQAPAPMASSTSGAQLIASDGAAGDSFGFSASLSGNRALIGAFLDDHAATDAGSAYFFRNVDTASGTATENVKLVASDAAASDSFGRSVSLSGDAALVGAYLDDDNGSASGSAYIFRNLDTASGTVTETAKLTASDGAASDFFGYSVSLSGNSGLVGAYGDNIGSNADQGSAYLFRNLDTATGTVTESARLIASGGAAGDQFGSSVSLSGNTAVIGAPGDDNSGNNSGSAYVFRNLNLASQGATVMQDYQLLASDGAANASFGTSISLSSNDVLIGATGGTGAAYLFRDLPSTSADAVNETAKLTASDGQVGDFFGNAVSLSGNAALVGAYIKDVGGANNNEGTAYLFVHLDTASGTITEDVQLLASDGVPSMFFGRSVALDGDRFVIGADNGVSGGTRPGKAYTGTVSSVTTLDEGSSSRAIDGISFVSRTDWIIGQNTSSNQVTLTAGDSGNVTGAGKAVYIGQNAGSNDNTLVVEGSLTANEIHVGATANTGNTLLLAGTSNRINDTVAIILANGTFDTAGLSETVGALTLQGTSMIDLGDLNSILRFANSSGQTWSGTLSIYDWSGNPVGGGTDRLYFGSNAGGLTSTQLAQVGFYSDNGMSFLGYGQILANGEVVPNGMTPVPEPGTWAAGALMAAVLAQQLFGRRKKRTAKS